MIGPKTREFAEIDITTMASNLLYGFYKELEEKGIPPPKVTPTVVYSFPATLAMIASLLVKKNTIAHPSFLFGSWWVLHYQAWLWKLSQRWREHVLEHWLKDLDLNDVQLTLAPKKG